jgi:cytochrome c oxidase assembly factor CtaG
MPETTSASPELVWSWAPALPVVLTSALALYVWRWWSVAAVRRQQMAWRLAAFGAGLLVLALALASPLARLGEQLVAVHTVQHLLITDLAPILLLSGLSRPLVEPLTPVLRRLMPHPALVVVLYAGTIATWHIPALYDGVVQRPPLHALQHATLFTAGLLFWSQAVSPVGELRRVRGMAVTAYMVLAKLLAGAVAGVLVVVQQPLFPYYAALPRVWGLSAVEDQQIGGVLMMSEQAIVMTTAFCLMFVRMLSESEAEADLAASDRGRRI